MRNQVKGKKIYCSSVNEDISADTHSVRCGKGDSCGCTIPLLQTSLWLAAYTSVFKNKRNNMKKIGIFLY